MAMFRFEFVTALHFLEQASPLNNKLQAILEPDGPLPFPEGWRRSFFRGTLLLLIGGQGKAAAADLRRAEDILPTAEGANNLGVAQICLGEISEARELFTTALDRFPGYLDAKLNLAAKVPNNLTTHPIRRQLTRYEYVA
jgi:hypothetical protein